MEKLEVTGWMSKRDRLEDLKFGKYFNDNFPFPGVFKTRGRKMDWPQDWPPVKVRITIEEIK